MLKFAAPRADRPGENPGLEATVTAARWMGWIGGIALVVLASAVGAGEWGLQGLDRVAVGVEVRGDVDPVNVEVEVLRTLRTLGVAVDPGAPAVLRVEVSRDGDVLFAGMVLERGVCLERDPLVCARVPTWAVTLAARGDPGVPGSREEALQEVLGRLEGAWERANPRP